MKKINIFETFTNKNEVKAVSDVIKGGWLTSGKLTKSFESKVKNYLNCKNVIAVNSCTNGIYAVLISLGFKKGDEVITSPFTFISTINTLHQLGLKVVFVDINLNDYNIDEKSIKKKITTKTRFILVTHYGGNPFNIRGILKFSSDKIKIIEDAATALGSRLGHKKIGSFKNSVSIFSLYANKIITTGEGGLISTYDKKLSKKIRTTISIGINKDPFVRKKEKLNYKYDLYEPGYKFNFTDIQAAIGIEQLKKIEKIIKFRKKIRKLYNKNLKILEIENKIKLYHIPKDRYSSEYIYTILLKNKFEGKRDKLIAHLKKFNINTSVHYIPPFKLSYYKKIYDEKKYPNTKYIYENIISLPFHNKLSFNDVKYTCKKIRDFFK